MPIGVIINALSVVAGGVIGALIITPIGIVIPRLSKNTDTVQGTPCTVNLQSNN